MTKRKRKSNKHLKLAKETIGVGVASIAGQVVVGTISSRAGSKSLNTVKTINSGLQLTNVGQLAKVGKNIMG